MGLSERVSFFQANCKAPFSLPLNKFDAALSIDVILHLRDRSRFLSQVSRVLKPSGTFIFTDAGIITGTMTDEERERRILFGHTEFVHQGVNEEVIKRAGLGIINVVDSTNQLIANAAARLRARHILSKGLQALEGAETFNKQITYLDTVVDLAERRVLSRFTHITKSLGLY
jgi:SAM-dependent methyltransferase